MAYHQVSTLKDLVSKYPACIGVWSYQPFATAGSVPKQLVKKRVVAFMSKDRDILPSVIMAAKVVSTFEMMFVLKFNESSKLLEPVGVCAASRNQILLKPGDNPLQ